MADFQHYVFQCHSHHLTAHLRLLRNRLQRYCFFTNWPNFKETFFVFSVIFFVSYWFSALRFITYFASSNHSLALGAKSGAKLLLFAELSKFIETNLGNLAILSSLLSKATLYIIYLGNYIRVDTDFILKDNFRQLRHQLLSIQGRFCFCSNEMQLCRIWRAKQNW